MERSRRRKGKATVERVYALTSLPPEQEDAARLLGICGDTEGLRTVCTGYGTWSSVRTKARCERSRRRNCWRHCGTW